MTPEDERRPISFRNWQSVLAAARLPAMREREFRRAILTFLHHCKTVRAPVSFSYSGLVGGGEL